jgi:hypothetical protein
MRIFRLLAAASAFLWAAGVLAGTAVTQSAKRTSGEKEKKSLIRMDLLKAQREEIGAPKRNIFSPQSSSRNVPVPTSGTPQGSLGVEEQGQTQGDEAQTPPVLNINLRYIGFIKSPRKMIGLIILEGQVMAVAEGEVVSEGIKIGKISSQDIDIIMPDSTTRKFSLEGE